MTNNHLMHPASCGNCGFTTTDVHLLSAHSCDVQAQGGRCEDFPCCGHEQGDCNGEKYGSDEAIKADAMEHFDCEHEFGYCALDEEEEPEVEMTPTDYEEMGSAMTDASAHQDEGYYLSGSGELSNDDSYIDYLNNY